MDGMIEKTYVINSKVCTLIIDNKFDSISNYLNKKKKEKNALIITDDHLINKYGIILKEKIDSYFENIYIYIVKSGEKSKNIETCCEIYTFIKKNNMTKSLVILALGGGVVGDISGFVASTYKCGVRFIQVPTSFLAQIDSSIGGKNAINFNGIKNVIGTVYQPELIYINYSILSSLSPKELINGLVEMTVHGIIREKSLFEFLENNDIQSLDDFNGQLEEIIIKNCNVKLEIVKEDELDYNVRKILNFGHTIGHAIEGYYMFKYSHGECVAVGIVGSFLVGKRLGITPQNLVARIITYIKKMKINIHLSDMDVNEVLHLVEWDKKNNGKYISYIIPVDIGIVKMVNLSDNSCIEQAINDLIVIFN